ncbi:MAG: transcription elongation factor GreA [Firmicutes bacterium]|nr:transcription elongation factor GreA [Bacillota bacterium]
MNEEILITKEGYNKLVEEHDYLVSVRREEVSRHLKEAKSYGDLSENAEYDAAKDEQAELEDRIQKLENMIRNAKVIDEEELTGEHVNLGLTVDLLDRKTGEKFSYQIVGVTMADPLNDKISNESPLGKELMGKEIGNVVEVPVEDGTLSYEILNIRKQ